MKSIIIIGIYPPPLGGISIHIKRLRKILINNSFNVKVINEGIYENKKYNIVKLNGYKNIFKILKNEKADIVHFHSLNKYVRAFLWLFKKFSKEKIILTIHGQSLLNQYINSNFVLKKLLLRTLNSIDKTIFVDENNVEFFKRLIKNKDKVIHINSFLLPNKSEREEYSNQLIKFLKNPEKIILINGNVRLYKNEDLYGFNNMIEICNTLIKNNFRIKLILVVIDVENQSSDESKYYNKLKEKVKDYNILEYVFFYESENKELWPLLEKIDLFVRPTVVDGYGVSIAEAIYLGIPSIATNVCTRPNGTILCGNSRNEIYNSILDVLNNYDAYIKKVKQVNIKDSSNELLELYNNV